MGLPVEERRGQPLLLDQLAYLPPTARIAAGGVMLGMGVAGLCMQPGSAYAWLLLVLSFGIGAPLVLLGLGDRRRLRVEVAELERARAELPDLRVAVATAVQARQGVRRVLRERGYTSDKAQRWIALECDVVLARGDA